jgi:hypothetical protein
MDNSDKDMIVIKSKKTTEDKNQKTNRIGNDTDGFITYNDMIIDISNDPPLPDDISKLINKSPYKPSDRNDILHDRVTRKNKIVARVQTPRGLNKPSNSYLQDEGDSQDDSQGDSQDEGDSQDDSQNENRPIEKYGGASAVARPIRIKRKTPQHTRDDKPHIVKFQHGGYDESYADQNDYDYYGSQDSSMYLM